MPKIIKKLSQLFEDLVENTKQYLNADQGTDFESRIQTVIGQFTDRIYKDNFTEAELKKLRVLVVNDKNRQTNISNNFKYKKHFIYQPFGSQNYPDFVLFLPNYLIPIEIKFSAKNSGRPVWNSNLPKYEGFYIFGCYGQTDLTFFKGEFVLNIEERRQLTNFWSQTDEYKKNFAKIWKEQFQKNAIDSEYGFFHMCVKLTNKVKRSMMKQN